MLELEAGGVSGLESANLTPATGRPWFSLLTSLGLNKNCSEKQSAFGRVKAVVGKRMCLLTLRGTGGYRGPSGPFCPLPCHLRKLDLLPFSFFVFLNVILFFGLCLD